MILDMTYFLPLVGIEVKRNLLKAILDGKAMIKFDEIRLSEISLLEIIAKSAKLKIDVEDVIRGINAIIKKLLQKVYEMTDQNFKLIQKLASKHDWDFYFPHPNLPKLLAVTARRHDLIAVLVSDSLDTTWPSIGLVQWYDPEADEYFLTDTTSRAVRTALAATQARRYERIVKDLHRTGVDTIHVTTGSAYEKALITFFHSREIRRGM